MSEELRPLTPEEEKLPYAKYYYRPMATPNPRLMEILSKGPMDPAKALPLERLNDLLDPGYHEVETGYCVMDNGLGYVAVNNVFPGCTVEMLQWWFAWHAAGTGLRYKIWCPTCHGGITVCDSDRRKLLDPSLPLEEKYTGVDHFVMEDIGGGLDDIIITFLKPEQMGFDPEKLKTSPVKAMFGGYGLTENRAHPTGKVPAVMIHTCREIEGGVEFRTRFWMGARINKGVPMCVLPQGLRVPVEAPMGLAFHNVVEFSNLASILPELYAQFGPDVK